MKYNPLRFQLLTILVLLIIAHTGQGQTPLGSIDVWVKDANGAVIPGANVSCENEDTGYSDTCTTGEDDGYCRVKNLPVGTYKVTVSASGFADDQKRVLVIVTVETQVQVRLLPGDVPSMVTIASTAPLVEPQSTTLGAVVHNQQITGLPLSGRNFLALAVTVPGSASDPSSGSAPSGSLGSISVNGSSSRSTTFVIDGLDITDSYRNTINVNEPGSEGMTRVVLPTEAVQEFSVSTNLMANAGRGAGALVNIALKSGGNDFNGSAFGYFQHEALGARNSFNSVGPKNKNRFSDFGFSVSGPIKRQRAFFFFTYEGQRNRDERTTLSSVPTLSDFEQAIIELGGSPAIPPENNPAVNPVIRNLFALCRNSGRCAGGTDLWPQVTEHRRGLVLNSLGRAPAFSNSDNAVVRLDLEVSQKQFLYGYFSHGRGEQSFPLALGGGDDMPRTNTLAPSKSDIASLSYRLSPTPYTANELRIGWNRYDRDFLDENVAGIGNPAQTIGLNTGVVNEQDFGLPHIVVRGFSALGASPYSNPRGRKNNSWLLTDSFVWTLGKHDIKFGYEFSRTTITSFNDVNFRGKLQFASLADFLAGTIQSGSILRGDSNRTTTQNTHALFFHDLIRLGPRFSLNFGARWDYFGAITEQHGLFSKYDASVGLIPSKQLYNADRGNVGPRFGVAWDLTGDQKTVVRSSAGIYFDSYPQDLLIGQVQFRTFNAGVAYNPLSPRPIQTSRSPVATIQSGASVFPVQNFITDSRDITTVDRIRNPVLINYNVNVQREVGEVAVLQVGYVGSSGYRLLRTRDINFPTMPGGARPFDNAAVLSSVAPNHPFLVNRIENSASSNYNSLQVSFRRNLRDGFMTNAQWTWSHFIDTASDGMDSTPNLSSPDNPNNPANERANSSFDVRHRFSWNFLYDLDLFDRFLSPRLKGWSLSGILVLSSGTPYHLNFGDEFDSQGLYDFILRPDVVGDPLFGTSSPDRLVNLAALKVPCTLNGAGSDVSNCLPGTLHFGNLPRNAFRAPWYGNLDYSISKTTPFTERIKLQLRLDVFNATNHPNFSSPLLPRFIAKASLKGIDASGHGGARGTGCNTTFASDDCYLPATRAARPRAIQLSVRLFF
jgi:hypothetical protein